MHLYLLSSIPAYSAEDSSDTRRKRMKCEEEVDGSLGGILLPDTLITTNVDTVGE